MQLERNNNYLLTWIESLQAQGKYTFTYEQACSRFNDVSNPAIMKALSRLSSKNKVVSVFKGFYVIITPEYSLKGMVPPLLFIDSLMKYAGRPYYVGLLSAAALHGAAHQRSQEFFVINQLPHLRPTTKKGIKINYIGRVDVPKNFLEQRKTEAGYVQVSNPELTAIDLLQYEKHIGGINRAATVINELAEVMKPEGFTEDLISFAPVVMLQRLGFILDKIVGKPDLGDALYSGLTKKYASWQRMPLRTGKSEIGFSSDSKWKIVVNAEIEIDE
jgi:predicted transcriptional regulator of viral defense system